MNEETKKDELVASEVSENTTVIKIKEDSQMKEIPIEKHEDENVEEETKDIDSLLCIEKRDDSEEEKSEDEEVDEEESNEPELKKSSLKPTELKAKASKAKPKSESMEETMLRLLLTEQNPELLESALANGKTIRGAWNYVVSVMKNAYIAKNGRVNGGMCGSPAVVLGIAEKYLREYEEGTVEPEVSHTPKKAAKTDSTKTVEAVAKKAASDAKKSSPIKKPTQKKKPSAQDDFFAALGL